MKKIVLTALLLASMSVGFSQSVFDKYENEKSVSAMVISKSMFSLLAKFEVVAEDKETKDFIDIAKSITSLKVFTTTDKQVAAAMSNDVASYLKSSRLSELMRFTDENTQIKFYVQEGKDDDHVKELLMFVSGISELEKIDINGRQIETVLLSLSGDIDLNKINALITKMNLPQELNKVNQKQQL
ncbi:MAG: DUF4252 domain-containing protein [Flavobacteriaceae bacterium]|jgi:hypothetical protein|nr:DUF4252 domain-containing protein [Flavobacteriaceae bacterium]